MDHGPGTARRLAGETVLVTGAAQGIGSAIADVAAREGAAVALFDLTDPAPYAVELAARHGVRTWGLQVDVTDNAALTAAVSEVGPVSVLVNNAGRNARFDPVAMTEQDWDAAFALLLKAAWQCVRAVAPGMIEARRGSIVNIASIHARTTSAGFFPYAAAKAGLTGLTRSLALDLGRHGIRVNTVSPGWVDTPAVRQRFAESPGVREQAYAEQPLGRIGTPWEVAEVVCFLASPAASYVTGAEWPVDGGLSVRFPGPA